MLHLEWHRTINSFVPAVDMELFRMVLRGARNETVPEAW